MSKEGQKVSVLQVGVAYSAKIFTALEFGYWGGRYMVREI